MTDVQDHSKKNTAGKLMGFAASAKLHAHYSRYIPGGVSSNIRAAPAPNPLVIRKASGAILEDADGNEIIDYYCAMGPIILGHNDATVNSAAKDQMDEAVLAAGLCEAEAEAAEKLCRLVPCAEMVKFNVSGTEADQAAFRIARAATGRKKIVKFEGHYHGWLDTVLWSNAPRISQAGPREEPWPVAGSKGMSPTNKEDIVILPWNDLELLASRLNEGDIAAVVMEPAMYNAAAIQPKPGYLAGVREACSTNDTILIFDEVITGFRLAPGGAQTIFGVTPDLAVFAKAIANGFPIAAVAGRADLMDLCQNGVVHSGTYNAHPVCVAAASATLSILETGEPHNAILANGTRLYQGISDILSEAGIVHCLTGAPAAIHLGLGIEDTPTDWRDLDRFDQKLYRRLTTRLIHNGVRALDRGIWFLSASHDAEIINRTLDALRQSVKNL